jgi:hypothetical protein
MDEAECDLCLKYGPQRKSVHGCWSLKPLPLMTTVPVFIIVLISRSSNGRPNPHKGFLEIKGKGENK